MLDFLRVTADKGRKKGTIDIFPIFSIKRSTDLMIRGSDFYAIWLEKENRWSTDEQDAIREIDSEIRDYADQYKTDDDETVNVKYLWNSASGMIDAWHKYCQHQMRDNFHPLDETIIFSNQDLKKEDYATKKLPYSLEQGDISAYEELMNVLYSPDERRKLEWAIGSIVCGDSKEIQKFEVLYGAAGTGKSTVLNIIQMLFDGYCSVFDAKALGSSSNQFALEAFHSNPLVAIQHDGDLSKIEDNTRLNSLVSHEYMTVNEKFKSTYSARFNAFLFMGTNKPVRITDAKSGLIRRLIDVTPTGNKVPLKDYKRLMKLVPFELGAIAQHCLDVYKENPDIYDGYIPTSMLSSTNDFYDFMLDSYYTFKREPGVPLSQAWAMYKDYCDEAKVPYPFSKRIFRDELRNYFKGYEERHRCEDGTRVRSYYTDFRASIFDMDDSDDVVEIKKTSKLEFKEQPSIFDQVCADCAAQYATDDSYERPLKKWENCTTKLANLDTHKLHYVKVPENHIVIDFDIPDSDGQKDFSANLAAAEQFPPTYGEVSKSGKGIHLHYIYDGDVNQLSRIFDDHIEIKIFTGKASLRRKLTLCNNTPIAHISGGLPLKDRGDSVISDKTIKSERSLRELIKRSLNYDIHANTKPNIDFIKHILDEAYESGMHYDVSDMRNPVLSFAAGSSHQSQYCIEQVALMKFKSDEPGESEVSDIKTITFFDVEIFPNLFLVNWKLQGSETVARMINPTSSEIEGLLDMNLVGFNNRRYDNHMLYARLMGYTTEQLYKLSQRIISGDRDAFFGEAYNISYTDIYDFAAKKQSLKKWEIELGIHHQELGLPWDQPVPEDKWVKVAEYCDNDVIATEAVFNHLKDDFIAREILADIAGMSVNDTTNQLTTRIIFGKDRNPELVYTDLATGQQSDPRYHRTDIKQAFPGYEYVDGKNIYRGVDLGKGGYVYSEPGMYTDVALLDVASLHPHSITAMQCFGKYTKNFEDLMDARIYIKHEDYDSAGKLFGGKLKPYLKDTSAAGTLSQALKIAINSVYGLTSANFKNPFRDNRNKNNIVALRGALFMKTLQDEVAKKGYTVAHIKTDSIKIPNADNDIINFCMKFAEEYGYTFEHEATYERMCLVNDAVYIAKYDTSESCQTKYGYIPKDVKKHPGQWTATGAQFAVPYVFKSLFSHEPILFEDMCETKSVQSSLYLDKNEELPQHPDAEKELDNRLWNSSHPDKKQKKLNQEYSNLSDDELRKLIASSHNYSFVGRVGLFCPMKPGSGGGWLVREQERDGIVDYYSVGGAKGYRWMEAENVKKLGLEDQIDKSYYQKLVDDAVSNISQYGDIEWFMS